MKKRFTLADVLIHFVLFLLGVLMIVPFYTVVLQSFATPAAIAKQPVYLIPTSFTLASYKAAFDSSKIWGALGVSVFVTLIGAFMNVTITTFGAYALTKKYLPGCKLFIGLIIFQMLFSGGLIPTYLTIMSYKLLDSVFAMILPTAVNTFYLIIMMNYFKTVSESLEESARIDGANHIQVLLKIILPISLPILATITLFYAVDRWNEWYNAMIYLTDFKKYPLQLYLRELLADVTKMNTAEMSADEILQRSKMYTDGLKSAMVVITALPILLVYPFLQRYFTTGAMVGAVKE